MKTLKSTLLVLLAFGAFACSSSDSTAGATATTSTTTTTAAPTFSPAAGAYSAASVNVAVASTTSGSTICYSTSTTPVCNAAKTGCATGTVYATAVAVNAAQTLRAVACKSGNNDSSTTSGTYTQDANATLSASVENKTASINGGTGCITNVNTTMDAALPSRIKDNFKCQVAYVSGGNWIFKSSNLPNTTSFYWAGKTEVQAGNSGLYALFAALPGGTANAAGTNVISSENLQLTISSTPTAKVGALTGTQNGYVAVGLTVNGLAIFNNAAAPPDTLATEAATFDGFDGHPQNTGIYHHHAGVRKVGISGSDNNDANLIGIALDGYLIYGKKCDNATPATGDDVTLTAPTGTSNGQSTGLSGASATSLDQLHGHTTTTNHLSTATYHYHMASDPVATIDTLLGSYFYGVAGTASN